MAAFSLVAIFPTLGLRAESLEMWISSFQDQVYYENLDEELAAFEAKMKRADARAAAMIEGLNAYTAKK
mgnify:CR=1 FL=1